MVTGGCYCGDIRYEIDGEPFWKGQCHCRECQYFTGGHPNIIVGFPSAGFRYISGQPAAYTRPDFEGPATREFCPKCGTQLLTRPFGMDGAVMVKVGTLDNPSIVEKAQVAIYTKDKQAFHHVPEGIPAFEGLPEG